MAEIILWILLGKLMYDMAEEKDLPPIPFVILFLGMWIGCEIVGIALAILFGPPGIGMICGMYVLAFMGAALGGGSVFAFVAFYPRRAAPRLDADVPDPKEFFRKKDKKRRRRRQDDDDDEHDERPRRRPRDEEEYDEPRPSRARNRSVDDDQEPDTRIRRRRDN
jgi:hypothetical protein